jgi:hypothetical protein
MERNQRLITISGVNVIPVVKYMLGMRLPLRKKLQV